MADDTLDRKHQREREEERRRLREQEGRDLEVEARRGTRPLEGYAGGHTTWVSAQDDAAASRVHAHDAEESWKASERQARLEPEPEDAESPEARPPPERD
ncbi:hypothetical protein LZ198_37975 [Myxococcus sp. K15C18031901]|uniref:hypothetical protein n=1 Tax=Myxococcus dinghuensis TaxID=2906761 RepID=UPI0020A7BFA2|nr:hypothetical protein [Myxococcus dinghuensis]MCP3104669.1 hypothetical protein [Myxococcus dinghuensis]